MMKILSALLLGMGVFIAPVFAQTSVRDTQRMESVTVLGNRAQVELKAQWDGQSLVGTKVQTLPIGLNTAAHLSEKTARQLFAQVPGVFVYDMDGSGNQINLSTRGLDAHRSWEFNVRQNGALMNTDLYGYPASHYSPPMEAMKSVEVIRGSSALLYGSQFGGVLNYSVKDPSLQKLGFEAVHSLGSFGLRSGFYRVSGTLNQRWSYQAYAHARSSQGYRDNAQSQAQSFFVQLNYTPNDHSQLTFEWSNGYYQFRIPGPLSDSMFAANSRQSTRSRNYYSPNISLPVLHYKRSWETGHMTLRLGDLLGARKSIQVPGSSLVVDSVDAHGKGSARWVDVDLYNSQTLEWNLIQLANNGQWDLGIQGLHNQLWRRQLGHGSAGSDADYSLTSPGWGRDIHLRSWNAAAFVQRSWIWNQTSLRIGTRVEDGFSDIQAKLAAYAPVSLPDRIKRMLALPALGFEQTLALGTLYAGYGRAYRPVVLKDLIPANQYQAVDPGITDVHGYVSELGWKGSADRIRWDIGLFSLRQNNKVGSYVIQDSIWGDVVVKSSLGDAWHRGVEWYVAADLLVHPNYKLEGFQSGTWMNATYLSGKVNAGGSVQDLAGNQVESAPHLIVRTGLELKSRHWGASVQGHYTSGSYADPINTYEPTASGSVGFVPSYFIVDASLFAQFSRHQLRFGVNNLGDASYFTKRPAFYPGPGVWSSDSRSLFLTYLFSI
jgi:Fe(3+) dicitrate transport protein